MLTPNMQNFVVSQVSSVVLSSDSMVDVADTVASFVSTLSLHNIHRTDNGSEFRSLCGDLTLKMLYYQESSCTAVISAATQRKAAAAFALLLSLLPQKCEISWNFSDGDSKRRLLECISDLERTITSTETRTTPLSIDDVCLLEERLYEIQNMLAGPS
jgi:hypothetical protein